VADVGIVGENVLFETGLAAKTEKKLGFGKCRLSLAVPKDAQANNISYYKDKKIATSYPNILKEWLAKNNLTAQVEEISGSVEIATGIGLADAICDLVSSGSTLISNGLKETEILLKSEAVLISTPNLDAAKRKILEELIFRIDSVQKANNYKYILLNAPLSAKEEIIKILPGMKSPTVLPLAQENWCSIHTVIEENKFWEIINKLKSAGAQGILVVPIEKMII
jgi:ATP phosphoribosyltransferase